MLMIGGSSAHQLQRCCVDEMSMRSIVLDVPFGRVNVPFSDPRWSALLNCAVKTASLVPARLLLAWTYFLRDWRL